MATKSKPEIMFSSNFLYSEEVTQKMSNTDPNNFGILTLKTEQQPPQFKWINWVVNIDRSASMSDICADRKTKMDHILHTLKNMVDYFVKLSNENENLTQYITIISFDHEANIICNNVLVNSTLCDKIQDYFDMLQPRGSTNIDYALRVASENINSTIKKFNATGTEQNLHQISHIFMSDGHITHGETNSQIILEKYTNSFNKSNVQNYNITNTFIGFGTHHDARLMKTLSNSKKGEYYFIESLENAGMVYGEILYNSLYAYLQNLTLTLENGEIYNFKKNTWEKKLCIETISSGQTRTWHIRKTNNEKTFNEDKDEVIVDFPVTITGDCNIALKTNIVIPTIHPSYPTEKNTLVEKYLWRQKTQEMINNVNEFINNPKTHNNNNPATKLYPGADKDPMPISNNVMLPKPMLYHNNNANKNPCSSTSTMNAHGFTTKAVRFSDDALLTEEHEILDAAKSGNWVMVWSYLNIYPSLINCFPSPRKFNLIHHAIHQENVKALEKLVCLGGDVRIPTIDGITPPQLIATSTSKIIRTALENIIQFAELKKYGGEEIQSSQSKEQCIKKSKKEFESELNNLMIEIKEYMTKNDLQDDGFMKNLCDDIYVCTKTLTADVNLGNMYLIARGTSHGNERAYNASDFTELDRGSQPISMTYRGLSQHVVSDSSHTAYASKGATKMMRAVSHRA